MNKKFFSGSVAKAFFAIIFATSMGVGVTSCSSDDDDINTPTTAHTSVTPSVVDGEYNINNYSIEYNGKQTAPITKDNWRQADGIFLYVGEKGDASIHDTNNAGGYTYVNLPWHKGNVQTNLPNGFCDEISPEKGWELALNCCGNRSISNGNFFALYNKWTGTLRFFYYMPEGFSTGNDHVWEVSLTNNLADRKLWGFGLPAKETLKDRTKLSAVSSGTQVDYVTPWVAMRSKDGLIVPNTGWWAFDVDLSLYRPNADLSNDNIRLQMRSWTNQHVSLYSTMTANIDGTIKQQVDGSGASASSVSQGVCTTVTAGLKIASTIAKFKKGDFVEGLGGLADVMGLGSEFAGMFGGDGPFEAMVSLGLNGTVDTDGFIQGSTPTAGVASPTFQLKDFDLKNSHVGQGVWNIKSHPVVDIIDDAELSSDGFYDQINIPADRFATPYFFDPSSIEVELNPNVFPESEVEWMQVDATCVATKAMGLDGTDLYRQALGLSAQTTDGQAISANVLVGGYDYGKYENQDWWFFGKMATPQCDYLYYNNEKGDMSFPNKIWEKDYNFYVTGRGVGDKYAIEPLVVRPQTSYQNPGQVIVPALMVNVVVSVKMRGMSEPIQFSRNYLPEIQKIKCSQMDGIYQAISGHKLNAKQTGRTKSYDYQVKRIGKLIELWKSPSTFSDFRYASGYDSLSY